MALDDDLVRVAAEAARHSAAGETVAGVVPAEADGGARVYLCAYEDGERRTWLVLDGGGRPVDDREAVRAAAALAALCEIAVDAAGGGDLPRLRAELLALRLRENPPGLAEAEEAALALERVVDAPRVASAEYLDAVGTATKRLERALGGTTSPFAEVVQQSAAAVEALAADVLANYKLQLA